MWRRTRKSRHELAGPSQAAPGLSIADPPGALAEARRLADAHRYAEAIDLLATAFRRFDSDALAIGLIDLRVEAANAQSPSPDPDPTPWPPDYPNPFPDLHGHLPEIEAHELTSDILGGAVCHHGALIVRHLLDNDRAATDAEAIRRANTEHDLYDEQRHNGDGPGRNGATAENGWYRPVPLGGDKSFVLTTAALRQYVRRSGGTWLADSPRATALFLDQLAAQGVVEAIRGHFGERPVIAVQKSTLRQIRTGPRLITWHQDGAFLGPDVRTMNVWVALSPCGGDYPSPGLQVVPFRVPTVLPTNDSYVPHSVAGDVVAEVAAEVPAVVPSFEPGDAILFDELFLHRTYVTQEMVEDRYAIECWFFAPSHASPEYVPLLV